MMSTAELTTAAEHEWLDGWTAGPQEPEGTGLPAGTLAPDFRLSDHTGRPRLLSEFWVDQPALIMFWRHFGCGCGFERAARFRSEYAEYLSAGLAPVIVAQGEPARAAAYRSQQELLCPVLCDPWHAAYRAYGLGQWQVARVLFDAPPEYWSHPRHLGVSLQDSRREQGRPPVDDPWRATGEFVVGPDGLVTLSHVYQHCEDFPDPRVLTTAARLTRSAAASGVRVGR